MANEQPDETRTDAARFEVQVLTSAGTIQGIITQSEAESLLAAGHYIFLEEKTKDERVSAAVSASLAATVEAGKGFWTMFDEDGRHWVIPSRSIYAFGILDRTDREPSRAAAVGFQPSLGQRK